MGQGDGRPRGVLVRDFVATLGRFGFSAGALPHFRPFLGPLHAWAASVPGGAFLDAPIAIKVILSYLASQLDKGHHRSVCRPDGHLGDDHFRADAKAEGEDVAMGGWECKDGTSPAAAAA